MSPLISLEPTRFANVTFQQHLLKHDGAPVEDTLVLDAADVEDF